MISRFYPYYLWRPILLNLLKKFPLGEVLFTSFRGMLLFIWMTFVGMTFVACESPKECSLNQDALPANPAEPLFFAEIASPYVDPDPNSDGSNTSFQHPIRVSITKANSLPLILSVHAGHQGALPARSVKVLRLDVPTQRIVPVVPLPGYSTQHARYGVLPSLEAHLFGERPPSWVGLPKDVLRSMDSGKGYNLGWCSSFAGIDCQPYLLENQTGEVIPWDAKAFSAGSFPWGNLYYAFAETSGLVRVAWQPMADSPIWPPMPGKTLPLTEFRPVPDTFDTSVRKWLHFGSFEQFDRMGLLVTSLNVLSRPLSVKLFRLDSFDPPLEIRQHNLWDLLKGQTIEALAVGLLNDDNYADVVYSVDGVLFFLINQGPGKPFYKHPYSLGTRGPVSSIAIADITGDHRADLIVAKASQKIVTAFVYTP